MISIYYREVNGTYNKNNDKRIHVLEVRGHAGAAEPGMDIVCAAVSVLVQTCAAELLKLYDDGKLKEEPLVELDEGMATIAYSYPLPDPEQLYLVIDTVLIGLENIAEMYSDYVSIQVNRDFTH